MSPLNLFVRKFNGVCLQTVKSADLQLFESNDHMGTIWKTSSASSDSNSGRPTLQPEPTEESRITSAARRSGEHASQTDYLDRSTPRSRALLCAGLPPRETCNKIVWTLDIGAAEPRDRLERSGPRTGALTIHCWQNTLQATKSSEHWSEKLQSTLERESLEIVWILERAERRSLEKLSKMFENTLGQRGLAAWAARTAPSR